MSSDANAPQFELSDVNQGESMIRLKGGPDSADKARKRPKVKMTDPFACVFLVKHYDNADEL